MSDSFQRGVALCCPNRPCDSAFCCKDSDFYPLYGTKRKNDCQQWNETGGAAFLPRKQMIWGIHAAPLTGDVSIFRASGGWHAARMPHLLGNCPSISMRRSIVGKTFTTHQYRLHKPSRKPLASCKHIKECICPLLATLISAYSSHYK